MSVNESSLVSVAAPFSFQGSAERIWRLHHRITDATLKLIYQVIAAALLIPTAWTLVLSWYCTFGLLVVPYRLIRRSQRNQRRDNLKHDELLSSLRSNNG